jgi:predicted molibdopterin-dependent oxidoreductase YjgC
MEPLGESKSELEILTLLARKLGFDWSFDSEADVFEELRKHLPQSAKIMI